MAKWYDGRVIDIISMTDATSQFFVRIESEDTFDFLPGQFVTMDLPIGEKRLDKWRSYSISSAPDGSNILEFCIVKAENGRGTKYLFEEISIGAIIKLKGPDGQFVLPKNLDREIVMICTGTGVAPFRSMLCQIRKEALSFRHIHLIFGTRYLSGILYQSELQNMAETYPNFTYDIALSRDHMAEFYHGYVHQIYKEKYQDVSGDRHFYICGWSQMIDQAVAILKDDLGYESSQIHYELYG